jgi:acyl carrier protein
MRTELLIQRFIDDRLLEGPAGGDPLDQGLLDSLALEQLIAFLEEHFGIAFSDEELVPENFETVPLLAALVNRKSGA